MKKILPIFILICIFPSVSSGQSSLAPCNGTERKIWHKCSGPETASNGDNYDGEYRDGKSEGYEALTYADGNVILFDSRK